MCVCVCVCVCVCARARVCVSVCALLYRVDGGRRVLGSFRGFVGRPHEHNGGVEVCRPIQMIRYSHYAKYVPGRPLELAFQFKTV